MKLEILFKSGTYRHVETERTMEELAKDIFIARDMGSPFVTVGRGIIVCVDDISIIGDIGPTKILP